jgi:hypothetical protein
MTQETQREVFAEAMLRGASTLIKRLAMETSGCRIRRRVLVWFVTGRAFLKASDPAD